MTQDVEFWDGFDTYGPTGYSPVREGVSDPNSTLLTKWTSLWDDGVGGTHATMADLTVTIVDSLSETGQALELSGQFSGFSGPIGISKTLPASYERIIFETHLKIPALRAFHTGGVVFGDGSSDQLAVCVNAQGQIELRRGSGTNAALTAGTLLATSNQSLTAGVSNTIKGDLTFANSGGVARIWLNNLLTTIDFTGDTQNTANATVNTARLMISQVLASGFVNKGVFDHFWLHGYLSAGGGDAAPPGALVVESQFPIADDSVDFAIGAAVLGEDWSATTTTNAPGANQLVLRQFTPDANGTLDSVSILPEASSATAKFKMCAYADSAGSPGALLSSGPEVEGCTAGEVLTGALTTPQGLTTGTPIWKGFITDTSVALALVDDGVQGRKIANTYGSGAPGTAGAMTANQPSWVIFGAVSGVTDSWSVVDNNPFSGDRSYTVSSNVNDKDIFIFPVLSNTPTTIYGVSVEVIWKRADAGARTLDLITVSGATTGAGLNPGISPPTTYGSGVTYLRVDPDTVAAWNASGVNLAKHGYKIAS